MNTLGDYMRATGFTDAASKRSGGTWVSEPEARLTEWLVARGFRFDQQVRLPRGDTTVVLDFLVEDTLAVEVDGKAFHDTISDSSRDAELRVQHGIWTLRVPAWKAMRYPDEVVALIALKIQELSLHA